MIPRDRAGADEPLAPQILLALLEDGCDICLLPLIRNLTVTNDREWPCSDIGQLSFPSSLDASHLVPWTCLWLMSPSTH